VEHDYFQGESPQVWDEPGTYADLEAKTVHNTTYEWNHALGDVVSALVEAGLVLEFLHEHGFDTYRLPEGTPKLPLMYSLRARKPEA
jgi:hypothetical protein